MNTQLTQESIFEDLEPQINRRKLLPWWMKVFCWLFMVLSFFAIVCLIAGVFSIQLELSVYGFETYEPMSLMGLFILGIMLFKGYTAYALWFEKDEAIKLGIIDAWIGIVICTFSMLVLPFITENGELNLRLELVFLIPYLSKLQSLKKQW